MAFHTGRRVVDHVLIPREDHKWPGSVSIDHLEPPVSSCLLLELPTEIVQHIASYCERRDLQNLRLTCQELKARTKRVYLNVFYGTQAFLLTSGHSLQALLAISKHPDCGKALRKLVLRGGIPKDAPAISRLRREAAAPPFTRSERAQRRTFRDYVGEPRAYHQGVWSSLKWLEPLRSALTNLAEHGRPLHIKITDAASGTFAGQKFLACLLGLENYMDLWRPGPREMDAIMVVCFSTPATIERFEVAGGGLVTPFNTFMEKTLFHKYACQSAGKKALGNLRSLTLTVSGIGKTDPVRRSHVEGVVALVKVFAPRMHNLQELQLYGGLIGVTLLKMGHASGHASFCVSMLLKNIRLESLRALVLDALAVDCSILKIFAMHHIATLKSVTIDVTPEVDEPDAEDLELDYNFESAAVMVMGLIREHQYDFQKFEFNSRDVLESAEQRLREQKLGAAVANPG